MEQVQSILERMVAPLKDLRDRGIFSQEEIHAIVQRRRSSEMLLQRRSGIRKSDYLRYIEDEMLLERLRKLRKQKVLSEMRDRKRERYENGDDDDDDDTPNAGSKKHAYQTSGPGDAHIVSHLHFIYQRTLRKFNYPIDVVLNYAQFARDFKSFHHMSRIYAEGLQRHPREEGLWIEAASFEFFGYVAQDYENGSKEIGGESSTVMGSSIQNARVLMQRGLRINGKTSQELWLQYFALELHYVQKLRGRREILELGLNKEGLPIEEGSSDAENDEENRGVQMPSTLLLPSQIIFKNAIKAIPDNIQFRLRFVETCRQFPQTEQLESCIMGSITKDFGESVEGWVARISYADEGCRKNSSKRQKGTVGFLTVDNEEEEEEADEVRPTKKARKENDPALELIDEALAAVQTPAMYLECARFLRMRIQQLLEETDQDEIKHLLQANENPVQSAQRHAELLERIYSSAKESNVSSNSLTLDNADFFLSVGLPERGEELLGTACRSNLTDARLQLRWSQVSQRMEAAGMKPSSSSVSILRRALRSIPMHDRAAYLMTLTELMNQIMIMGPPSNAVDEELKGLFQKVLLVAQGSEFSIQRENKNEDSSEYEDQNLAAAFLSYFRYTVLNNTSAARSIYTTVLYHSSYCKQCTEMSAVEIESMKSFFDACIQFETSNKPSGSKEKKNAHKRQLCKLYESAVSFFSSIQSDGYWRKVVDSYRKELQREKYSL